MQLNAVLLTAAYCLAYQLPLLSRQMITGKLSQYNFQLPLLVDIGPHLKCPVSQMHPPLNAKKGAQAADVFPRTVRLLRLVFIVVSAGSPLEERVSPASVALKPGEVAGHGSGSRGSLSLWELLPLGMGLLSLRCGWTAGILRSGAARIVLAALLAVSVAGIFDLIQVQDDARPGFATISDCPGFLVIAGDDIDVRTLLEFHALDTFAHAAERLDSKVQPAVVIWCFAVIDPFPDAEVGDLTSAFAVDETDRRCVLKALGHNSFCDDHFQHSAILLS